MKRIMTLFILILLIILIGFSESDAARMNADSIKNYKDIPGVTQDEIAAVEKLKKEQGGFSYGYLIEQDSVMLATGVSNFSRDFCDLLAKLFDAEFKRKSYDSWQLLKKDVDDDLIDFTCDLTFSSERQVDYIMSESIADHTQKIYMLTTSKKIVTEKDVNGLKLGFLQNSVNFEYIHRRYPGLSFELVPVDYIASVEKMLLSGEIDAFVTERDIDVFFTDTDLIYSKDFFSLAYTPITVTTANTDLAPLISVLNKYLKAGGGEKLYAMCQKHKYEDKKRRLMKSFTEDERSYLNSLLADAGGVPIALEHDNYPFSFYNETEKEFQGLAVDILAEVSKLTNIRFKNITNEKTTWAEIIDKLEAGKVPIISHLCYTESREKSFIWSKKPYSTNSFVLISKIDFPKVNSYQIPRMKIGVLEKSLYQELISAWFPECKNIAGYPTMNAAFDALENGEVDLIMGAEFMLMTQVNYREKPGFMINYFFDTSMNSQFGFNKKDEILRSIIDKSLEYVEVKSMASYWNSRVFDYSKKMAEMQAAYLSVITLAVIVALAAMSFLFITNRKLSKRLLERSTTLAAIFSSIPDTIFCKDTTGVYTSCNPSFEKQAGIPEAELIGKTYAEVFKERVSETVELYKDIDKKVMSSRMMDITEEKVVYPDGSRKILETIKVPLIQNGNVIGLLGLGRDVTERKEVKSRLERVINTAHIAFIMSIDGIVMETNEYSEKTIGTKVGDDIRAFYSEPGQRDTIIAMAEKYGTASNAIVKFNMANGGIHRFLASFTFVEYEQQKAYIIWALDIEEDELKTDRLIATQQSLQTVLDTLPMPIRIVDSETAEIVYVNKSLLDLLEYDSSAEICGLSINSILPEILTDGTASVERSALPLLLDAAADPISVEMDYLTKTGKIIEAIVVTSPIDYRGRLSTIGIIKDLTKEKEKARLLFNTAEREKEANQLKSIFLANMSHEIRTPMNGIIGMTDLLLNEKISGRQLQYVKDIKTSAESLLGIINDILDLSKINEKKLQIMPVDIDLCVLLKNTVSMMGFSAQSKGLDFVDDIHVSSPEYVRVDDVRLKQILINLLSNAVKFTESGYVKFMAKIENDNIVFEISDTGTGIKEEDATLIFRAFEQANNRKNRAIKGTGLGLSISKNLVELMGGKIWVESKYGVGTTFYVQIPYVHGDESAVEVIDTSFNYISAPTAQILLVDDIQTNLTVGAGLLRLCGITVDVAISGQEAIELVKSKDYDIVFMDHMMPEMDGIEAMNLIRDMGDKYRNLPIIALTANAVSESRDMLLASGMDDFISKPIEKSMLMNILRKWLPPNKIETDSKPKEAGLSIPYPKTLVTAAKIKGIDIELALTRMSGMADVLEQSLKQTAYSLEGHLKEMGNYMASEDLKGFAIKAHGLKGVLANIGAINNSELAADLEIAAKAGKLPLCAEKFPAFADIMRSFANELKSVFSQAEPGNKPQGEIEFLKNELGRIIDCLDNFKAIEALELLSKFNKFTFDEKTDAKLNEAIVEIEAFNYDKAIDLLKEI